jgi:hypothetical protein
VYNDFRLTRPYASLIAYHNVNRYDHVPCHSLRRTCRLQQGRDHAPCPSRGSVALQLSRARHEPVAARRAIFARFLRQAWADAKAEAASLIRQAEHAAAIKTMLAERARQSVALVASYGGTEGVCQAISSEYMRDRMDFAAIATLEAALSASGAER